MAWQKTCPPPLNLISSSTPRDRYRLFCAEYRMSYRKEKQRTSSITSTPRTQKMCFGIFKTVYRLPKPCTTPLLTADDKPLLKEKNSISERWKETFRNLLNRTSAVNTDVMDQILQKPTVDSLNLVPTLDEVKEAIS